MDSSITPQMQPETLIALNNFITQWNADSASLTNTLLITGNQFSLVNERILDTLPTTGNIQETEDSEIPPSIELDSFEQLLATIDFNPPNNESTEITELFEENIISSNISNLETEQEDPSLEILTSRKDDALLKIYQDFTTNHEEPPIRISPLTTSLFDEQLDEIISRFQNGTRGKNRDRQIRTLEACYYLGSLKIANRDNFSRIKEISQTLQNKLGQ